MLVMSAGKARFCEDDGLMEHRGQESGVVARTGDAGVAGDAGVTTRRTRQGGAGVRFVVGRPQRWAAVLLLFFMAECLYTISRQELSAADFRYARCGREMWERPSPLAGYFTTCGNLSGDGLFAYRVAGLPLTLQRLMLLGVDHFRRPENRVYAGGSLNGSTWEARHEIVDVKYLLHVPFVLFAAWLGGGLWWVARRLFGNEGGAFALGLYVLHPAVIAAAVRPNNDVLAMWGLYGLVYTAIGVAHAMQGPRRKWRPRLVLLTAALGLTAAAHLVAAIFGWVMSLGLMLYVAERRRSYVMQILVFAAVGALVIELGFFSFHLAAFTYVFTGGSARFGVSSFGARQLLHSVMNAPVTLALAVAAVLWVGVRRSRYFGNTVPLLVGVPLLFVTPGQVGMAPWVWAIPFLLTFVGGVFADAFETRYRRLFLLVAGAILLTEAVATLPALGMIARAS